MNTHTFASSCRDRLRRALQRHPLPPEVTWSDGHNHYVLKPSNAGIVIIAFSGVPYRSPMIFAIHDLTPAKLVLRLAPHRDRLVVLNSSVAKRADSGASAAIHVTPEAAKVIYAVYGVPMRHMVSAAPVDVATIRA